MSNEMKDWLVDQEYERQLQGERNMRDPNRIDKICQELAEYWHKLPDWRLTQLLCNLQSFAGNDMFYCEDERFLDYLAEFFGVIGEGK